MICRCSISYWFFESKTTVIEVVFIKQKRGWEVLCLDKEFWFNSKDFPSQKDAEYFYNIVV